MRVIVCENYEELSVKAARIVAGQIHVKPNCVLGLATGSTPVGMYKKLIEMNTSGEIDFSEVSSFNLDEYYPIKKDNHQSYQYFMNENLFNHINIDKENTHIPNGEAEDPIAECKMYEKSIKQHGGIDLQILGIGQNGHIGFNEPDACLNSFTHLTNLTESTLEANSRFFTEDEVMPTQALTMGISSILNAKKIILLASGASKHRVVTELMNDTINTNFPASMLKTHPDVVLICDKEAFSGASLGVDIGGTNIKFAVVDDGDVVYKSIIKTADTCEKIVDDIVKKFERLKKNYHIKTVGIGTPGIIKNGKVTAINLPFDETPLAKLIKKRIDLPVNVDNDANCAALGEVTFGSAIDCDNIVLVTLGTGVGGGIVMDRRICRGKNSMGEIGHIVVQTDGGLPCPCGLSGCWEQYASATALIREATAAAKSNPDSILSKLYEGNFEEMTGELIFEALDSDCPVAKEVFDKYIKYLAVGIRSIVNVFGPDAIVLAGGITKQGDKLITPLKQLLPDDVRIEISNLQSDAGALGAAVL